MMVFILYKREKKRMMVFMAIVEVPTQLNLVFISSSTFCTLSFSFFFHLSFLFYIWLVIILESVKQLTRLVFFVCLLSSLFDLEVIASFFVCVFIYLLLLFCCLSF